MTSEIVYTIELTRTNNGPAFEIKASNPNSPKYLFEFIGNRQFFFYSNGSKLIEAKSLTNKCDYSFKYGSIDLMNDFRFYSKYKISAGYKLTRKRSYINDEVNWSWNYSTTDSCYELINKKAQGRVIARISGLSLDGQKSGMLVILRGVTEFHRPIIIFAACIVLYRSLLSPWTNFTRFLNFNSDNL